jgi:ketosteroid isomerase-like protein
MAHANEGILRSMDQAMLGGDIEKMFSFYTDDVGLHVRGQNKLAGDYTGKDKLMEMFGVYMQAMGEYSFENHTYLADDEHGIILQSSKSVKGGKTLAMDEVFVMHFRDGKVSEMWYVPVDGAAFDAWVGK